MSTVQGKTIDNNVLQEQPTSNGQTDISSANSIANLTINQSAVTLPTVTNYPPIAPTNLAYPAAVNPYVAYNPGLVYPPAPTVLAPVTPGLPTTTPNPYYAYQYPYTPYSYYQQPIIAPVLPVTTNQKTDKNGEDKSKSKNKNKKNKNQQQQQEDVEDEEDDDPTVDAGNKKVKNVLPFWGNEKTMNLNPLILTNVQNSPYFKNDLYQLKTYHEVVDEIYYQVKHLEPWERGSRKVGGQTGLNCSVRGVGAGGIVSTPFCILYKLYTLKLTRKQLNGLLKHKDSPYIRALGFMYVRFTQPPKDFWKWFEPYLEDEEEFEVKAGVTMTIGELCRHMMTKLDWFSTLFPRMPIPVQKDLENQLREYDRKMKKVKTAHLEEGELDEEYDSRKSKDHKYNSSSSKWSRSRSRSRTRSRSKSRDKHSSREDRYREKKDRDDKHRRSRSRERRRSKERSSHRDRSKERYRYR